MSLLENQFELLKRVIGLVNFLSMISDEGEFESCQAQLWSYHEYFEAVRLSVAIILFPYFPRIYFQWLQVN